MPASLFVRLGATIAPCWCAVPSQPAARAPPTSARMALTHLGGLLFAGRSCLPLWLLSSGAGLACFALATLVMFHLLVQPIKHTVGGSTVVERSPWARRVREPDRFSFPSGHATASSRGALVYGSPFPPRPGPLLVLAAADRLLAGPARGALPE